MINRRQFSCLSLLGIATGAVAAPHKTHGSTSPNTDLHQHISATLHTLERKSQGRLGVHILDTANGMEWGHRSDERFPMCSTFKFMACAMVLHRIDQGQESLERRIPFTAQDLITWSPVTEKHAASGQGMALGELCAAAMTVSDNTAANLILASYGGPPALTAFARAQGDPMFRLDRNEPSLNECLPGDPRDTTSPSAMLHSMQHIVLGDVLTPQSRETMQQWLLANTTGDQRLKASLPSSWKVGDKTGTGDKTANDIGVFWPPSRAPLLVTAYLTQSTASAEVRNKTLAGVGQLLTTITESR